jgi:hypothetical protein
VDQSLALFIAAATPGLVVLVGGIVGILRAPTSDRAARLRGARLNAIGFGLFVLGLALALAWVGSARGAWVLVVFAVVVLGPQVAFMLWLARRMRL